MGEYIKNITRKDLLDEFKNGEISFDEIIRPYIGDGDDDDMKVNNVKSVLLKEPLNDDKVLNIKALYQFENIITKQLKKGSDFELDQFKNLQNIDKNDSFLCNENHKCSVCLMFGVNSCHTVICNDLQKKKLKNNNPIKMIKKMNGNINNINHRIPAPPGNVDEAVKKKYLKLKQVSEIQVMESKIKSQNNMKIKTENNNNNKSKKN